MEHNAADLLAGARRAVASQPFSALLGAELVAIGADHTELRVPIRDDLKQQHGFVHGGVLCYAADNTLTIAGAAALGTGVVTSEFKINYLRPAIGDLLIARALVVSAGKTQAVCRCDVFVVRDGQERLCAVAQGTIALPARGTD
ncbi:MAG: PaaI family thioesterase [Acidobacteria bacterium]|nr:PaaI family thioesterase [Acidobacteriota bacterium]